MTLREEIRQTLTEEVCGRIIDVFNDTDRLEDVHGYLMSALDTVIAKAEQMLKDRTLYYRGEVDKNLKKFRDSEDECYRLTQTLTAAEERARALRSELDELRQEMADDDLDRRANADRREW